MSDFFNPGNLNYFSYIPTPIRMQADLFLGQVTCSALGEPFLGTQYCVVIFTFVPGNKPKVKATVFCRVGKNYFKHKAAGQLQIRFPTCSKVEKTAQASQRGGTQGWSGFVTWSLKRPWPEEGPFCPKAKVRDNQGSGLTVSPALLASPTFGGGTLVSGSWSSCACIKHAHSAQSGP